jgi:hypothetical protein
MEEGKQVHIILQELAKGRWVTSQVFAQIHGLALQTLANWRYQDHKANRTGARPGYPAYKRFGGAIRYWLPADEDPEAAA